MSAEVEVSDADARAAIVTALDETLVVEAAAGTGKTTELVKRIIAVIERGLAEMAGIVAVTFTEKAAGELRLRLRERLEQAKQTSVGEATRRLERAVQSLEEAHVSTIHGFCADLLRMRPVEARVDPLFRVLTEGQATRLLSETFDAWFRARLEDPPEGVRRSLRRASRGAGEFDDDGPIGRLRRSLLELSQWRDYREPWTRVPFARVETMRALTADVHGLADLTARASSVRDNLFLDTAPVRVLSDELRRAAVLDLRADDDGLESRLVELARHRDWLRARKGSGAVFGHGLARADVLGARDRLLVALDAFRVQADADLAAALHGELLECLDEYETRKETEGSLDFLDLLIRARNLVRDDGPARAHFQRRFTHIFVDEFQDTDPLQAELLLLLSASDPEHSDWHTVSPTPGKLFVVGDPKQSIYRFRRADVSVYRQVCDQLRRAGARHVILRKSFRSRLSLQRFVNAAFGPVMDGSVDRQQAHYVALEPDRTEEPDQPAIVALPVPRPYGARSVSAKAIEQSLPDAVGAYVHWLLNDSQWRVTERRGGDERVPIAARHVCILFRRFTSYGADITRPYLDALEARGVSHLLVGGRALHAREEIDTLRAALSAIERPDDTLSVFATLRGAFFAIGDEELLEYFHRGGRFHPFGRPPELPGRLEPIREALDALLDLHRRRNQRPVADTLTSLLARTRAHVGLALRPNGEQVLANVLHVAERARQYELEGGLSFRGFVDALNAEATEARTGEAPILEEGSDGVRVMTVHKAKGLEFPVVILADLTARLAPHEPSRTVLPERDLCAIRLGGWAPRDLLDRQDVERAREEAEGERVAYVAATRARDLLVVTAVGDGPWEGGWVGPLNRALYPPIETRRHPVPAGACPAFASRDSVLARPDDDPAGPTTVAPGAHRLGEGTGTYSVVWWSPESQVLPLDVRPSYGLRREDLVVKDVAPEVLQGYVDRFRAWQRRRAEAHATGSTPTFIVRTATSAAHDAEVVIEAHEVAVERVHVEGALPAGPRFGALVHAVLAEVPLGESPPAVAATLHALATAHGLALGADLGEVQAAERLVATLLGHDVLRSAARADARGLCYREQPVTCRLPSGVLIEGTVDLAFDEAGVMVVVDFKTDRDIALSLEAYRRQVGVYVSAIAAATLRPARGVLVHLAGEGGEQAGTQR